MFKNLLAGCLALLSANAAQAAPGDADIMFGVSPGYTRTDLGANDTGEDVLIDATGRIVVGGYRELNGTMQPVLAAYLSNGQPDTSFGAFGVTSPGPVEGGQAANVAIARNGNTLYLSVLTYERAYVWAYDANGVLISAFGSNGRATVPLGPQLHPVFDLAVWNGRLVLAAGAINPATNNRDFVLARLGANGQPDTSFDGDGVAWMRRYAGPAAFNRFTRVAVQPDGKLVAAGRAATANGAYNFVAARINGNGSLDTSFGAQGYAEVDFGGNDLGRTVTLQADGRIVLGGIKCAADGTACAAALTRLLPTGALDTGWATGGRFTITLDYNALVAAVALDPHGRPIAVGSMTLLDGTTVAYSMRLTTTGALDASFGGGVVRSFYVPWAYGMHNAHLGIVQSGADRFVVAGTTRAAGDTAGNIVVARYFD